MDTVFKGLFFIIRFSPIVYEIIDFLFAIASA